MMKKFTSLLIGCSLALAGAAMAQQPEETSTPKATQEKTHGATAKPGANAVKPEVTTKTQAVEKKTDANVVKPEATTAVKEHGARTEQTTSRMLKTEATPKSEKSTATETKKLSSEGVKAQSETNTSAETAVSPTPGAKEHMARKGMSTPAANAKTSATPATAASSATPLLKGAKRTATPVTAAASATPATTATPITAASASATPVAAASASATATVAPKGAAAKTPDVQQVQQIKAQHENFKAKPKPDKVPTVTFTANFQIQGSDRWQGPQYEVYRSYRPERHDRSWYHSRYQRVELVGGGYYYWNNGYWYPAWGYDNSAEYYAYDAPIYVGHRAEPPDRVIADVQAVLQNMGYYKGEVDGLLGPLTREALTGYQADRGLTTTAVIDEPTLDALGMG